MGWGGVEEKGCGGRGSVSGKMALDVPSRVTSFVAKPPCSIPCLPFNSPSSFSTAAKRLAKALRAVPARWTSLLAAPSCLSALTLSACSLRVETRRSVFSLPCSSLACSAVVRAASLSRASASTSSALRSQRILDSSADLTSVLVLLSCAVAAASSLSFRLETCLRSSAHSSL